MRLLRTLLLLAVSLLCLASLFFYDDGICTEHLDGDENFICDRCEAELEKPKDPICAECTDADGDIKCDACGKAVAYPISLISDGKCGYTFVIGSGLDGNAMMAINRLSSELKSLGAEVNTVFESAEETGECEILFGTMTQRADVYRVDPHLFGVKGYTVRIIGKKIIVLGGSVAALSEAVSALRGEFFGITDKTKALSDRLINPEDSISVIQSDYKVNKITLFGEDIRNYTIAIDKQSIDSISAAGKIQTLLYEKCGYWLPVVDIAEAGKSILISLTQKTDGEGLYASFSKGKIEFKVEYTTSLKKEIYNYFAEKIENNEGTLKFGSGDSFSKNVRDVFYKDFGAVGDGVTNDAEAILAAHRYAYDGGHKKIVAESGKTYYIGKLNTAAPIICDVDWTGAKFIIDDTVISASEMKDIFEVMDTSGAAVGFNPQKSDTLKEINAGGGIDASAITKIDLGLGYPAMLKVNNGEHKNYIRYGANASSGTMQTEFILVDAEGNIDPTTPFMFDYEKITSIYAYKINAEPITLLGGEFTTVAADKSFSYCSRGIRIQRSNVTVKNLKHYVIGEGEKGAPYSHFIGISCSNNVLVDGCVFSGHKTYYNSSGVGIGSYDINVSESINVTFKNCTQSNFFKEDGSLVTDKWGVMGSSKCKNITYDACVLTRFDAHEGVWNATIKNTAIRDIRIVGGGRFILDNCHIYKNTVISFREDYGAFWFGEVILKDVTVHSNQAVDIMDGYWYNHDFGYKTAAPRSITVDGLEIVGEAKTVSLFSESFIKRLNRSTLDEFISTNSETGETVTKPNINKVEPIEKITVKNIGEGIDLVLPPKTEFFENTVISEISP